MKKVIMCLLLLLSFGLLAGCGGRKEEEIVVGSDWRTWRGYSYATLHHEETVDVLLAIDAKGAVIYYDAPQQEEYGRVSFPYESADEAATVNNLTAEDRNEDGYDDLVFLLCYIDEGEEPASEECVFYWSQEKQQFELASTDLMGARQE